MERSYIALRATVAGLAPLTRRFIYWLVPRFRVFGVCRPG